MPIAPTYPGVYIEEIPSGVRTITGVATSIAAFVGRAKRGKVNEPVTINSFSDFERNFGGLWSDSALGYAVRDFFANGGSQAIVVRLFHPQFASDSDQAKAAAAACDVAKAAATAAAVANATAASVSSAAQTRASTYTADPEKTAAAVVAKAAQDRAAGPPGATPESLKDAASAAASDPAITVDAAKQSAALVATATRDAASQQGAMLAAVKTATTNAANDIKSAAEGVAVAAAAAVTLTGADADSVAKAARKSAADSSNAKDPRKSAADVAATVAENAALQSGATPASVSDATRAAVDAMKAAATSVTSAVDTEAAKVAAVVKDAAQDAIELAAPLTKARLTANGLNLKAANEGAWGNNLRVRIDHNVKNSDPNLFNVSVRDGDTKVVETFRNLTLIDGDPRNVEKVLANESNLVRVRGSLPAAVPSAHPDPTGDGGVWDDNSPTTNSSVSASDRSSDGTFLDINDFTGSGKADAKQGLYGLEKADLFNLLCIPPYLNGGDVDSSLITQAGTYCEKHRAMLLVDPPSGWKNKDNVKMGMAAGVGTTSKNTAIFFPRLRQPDPLHENHLEEFVPSGAVAGVFARTDSARGVWKAPAGLEATLVGVPELSVPLTDAENGELNPLGVNCLRSLPAAGRVVWGARTLQGDDRLASEWKYIPVRRLALFIEETLYRGTQWVVFEPNDEPLWAQIRLNVGAFMHNLFRQGAFQGKTPAEAYFVKCDKETTTQTDINSGIVNIVVGFAPLKPAEFVIIHIQQIAGQIQT
jgi:uncharacterized protein